MPILGPACRGAPAATWAVGILLVTAGDAAVLPSADLTTLPDPLLLLLAGLAVPLDDETEELGGSLTGEPVSLAAAELKEFAPREPHI